MKKTAAFLAAIGAGSLNLAACSDSDKPKTEDIGVVALEIVKVPDDVACVAVKVEGYRTVNRKLDVTPGAPAVLRMAALPTGLAKITGSAFAGACSGVSDSATPPWIAEVPVLVQIDTVEVAHVALHLVRNGRISVGVDFETTGPGATPPPPPSPVPGAGFSSKGPYIVPMAPGVVTKAILTVGDTVNLKPDGTTPYRMVGLPDGMGAFDNGDGTFTLLSNHEVGNNAGIARAHGGRGAFVSKWTVRKSDLGVLNGSDLIQRVQLWDTATSAYVTPVTPPNFSRFCGAELADRTAFFDPLSGLGHNGRIFTNGEESGDEGRGFAHLVDGTTYELPRAGKFSWENAVAHPNLGTKTLLAGLDDTGGGQVYFYLGQKTASGSPVDKAGLTNGTLYGLKVVGKPVEDLATGIPSGTAFELHPHGNVENITGAALTAASDAAGVTKFMRPEDGNWDPNNKNDFYFVSTASFTTPSRLWRVRFHDAANPAAGGSIDMLVDGTEGHKMFDNITVSLSGHVYLQEDPGGQDYLARIWRYGIADDTLTAIAQFDPAQFTPGQPGFLTRDEESSGIFDASNLLGPGWFLINAQVHASAGDPELVERGQFLALFDPAAAH